MDKIIFGSFIGCVAAIIFVYKIADVITDGAITYRLFES